MEGERAGRALRVAMLAVHSSPVGELGTQDTGGMSVYVREVARELGRMGHQVDIFTRLSDPGHVAPRQLYENVRLVQLPAGTHGPVHKLALYPHLEEFCREILRFCRTEGLSYDLLQSHYWLSGLVGARLKRIWRIPHFVVFHTLGALKNRTDEPQKEPPIRLRAERRLAATCDRVLASTQEEKAFLILHLAADPDRISVVPCGVDLELFQPVNKTEARRRLGFDPQDILILFVGRFAPLKGIDRLVASLSYLRNLNRVKLVVAGGNGSKQEGPFRQGSEARRDEPQRPILFPGRIEQSRLPLYYSAADLLVLPSQYESFGLVALEALACGTPVVATPVGAMPTLIRQGETGCLVPDGSPQSLAWGIETALTSCRGRPPEAIRASVLSFGWRQTVSGLLAELTALRRSPNAVGASSPARGKPPRTLSRTRSLPLGLCLGGTPCGSPAACESPAEGTP